MACRTFEITGDIPYYELYCDGCGDALGRYDESGYDWMALCRIATDAGWSAPVIGAQHCPRCVYGRTQRQIAPDAPVQSRLGRNIASPLVKASGRESGTSRG